MIENEREGAEREKETKREGEREQRMMAKFNRNKDKPGRMFNHNDRERGKNVVDDYLSTLVPNRERY
jgi:hypothetical protein